jgi:hypothetical protein
VVQASGLLPASDGQAGTPAPQITTIYVAHPIKKKGRRKYIPAIDPETPKRLEAPGYWNR